MTAEQDSVRIDMDMARSRPVDLVHLARYTLGERALECEVLGLFSAQSIVYVARLRASRSNREWREAAHSLKGSALAVGAWRAAEAAQGAEALPADALIASRDACLSEIEASVAEANDFIASFVQDR